MQIFNRISAFYFILWVSTLVLSCRQTNDKHLIDNQAVYEDAISANNILTNTIVVVPREGCGGCISEATAFIVKNKAKIKKNITIIFTGVGDYKLLKMQVGEAFILDKHVKIDSNNRFLAPLIASSYPTVISLDIDKKINYIVNFSTDDKQIIKKIMNE